MRFRARGMNSAIWNVKIREIWLVRGRAGSGFMGYKLVFLYYVPRDGGALRAAAKARPRSPARASVATLRILASVRSALDLVRP